MSTDAGQAALPGGKADSLHETPFMTARREAYEEIGLPMSDHKLPPGYTVEHLTELPANLAMTELGVRPCVAFLKAPEASPKNPDPDTARDILPKLDAREVAAVFTAPFYNFLRETDLDAQTRREVPGEWYKGSWHSWHESAWRMHQFFVPVSPTTVFLANYPRKSERMPEESDDITSSKTIRSKGKSGQSSSTLQPPLPRSFYSIAGDALAQPRYRVFGMTARILVDCARVAYGEEPEYEHNSHFGDEEMIDRLLKIGRLSPIRKEGDLLTRDVMVKASRAKI
jgi:8-oxo-dGTP pyrophosphatase MutT (NUDIX family)